MIRATQIAFLILVIVLIIAVGAVAWVAFDIHRLIVQTDARLNSPTGILARAQGLETKANATLINLDKGTATWAASAKDQANAITDLATDTHGTLSEVNQVAESLHGSADALHTELDSLHKTTDQATALAAALTVDAETANQTIAAGRPLLEASTLAMAHFDALVTSPDLSQALSHVQGMTASGDKMLADVQWKEHQLLHPDKVKLTFWGGMWTAAKYVHQFEPPIF